MRRLRQSSSIPEYIKKFTILMLEIEGLSDKDAFFYFRDGLKDWARIELDRQNVQTLDDAIAAVEMLTDFSAKGKTTNKYEGEVSKFEESDAHIRLKGAIGMEERMGRLPTRTEVSPLNILSSFAMAHIGRGNVQRGSRLTP